MVNENIILVENSQVYFHCIVLPSCDWRSKREPNGSYGWHREAFN